MNLRGRGGAGRPPGRRPQRQAPRAASGWMSLRALSGPQRRVELPVALASQCHRSTEPGTRGAAWPSVATQWPGEARRRSWASRDRLRATFCYSPPLPNAPRLQFFLSQRGQGDSRHLSPPLRRGKSAGRADCAARHRPCSPSQPPGAVGCVHAVGRPDRWVVCAMAFQVRCTRGARRG